MIQQAGSSKKPLFSGEAFERIVAILIALVTIIAALVGFLQVEASARSDRFLRQSQTFAVEAVGLKAGGEVQSSAWVDLLRLREELLSLQILADDFDDHEAAERFEAVIERLDSLSPILAPPYFDPDGDEGPNFGAFEADTYLVEATALSERFANAFEISQGWGAKADAYIAQLTLLAVTLFLFGLAVTLGSWVRWLFVLMGLSFTAITLVWMLVVYLTPVSGLPEAAILAYAEGVGWQHQEEPEQAIQAFNQALAAAPDYANARLERGHVYFEIDRDDEAAADFEAALAGGRRDVGAVIRLGWIYYLQGRLPEAIGMSQAGIDNDPDQVIHYFDLGVKRLVSGDVEAAQAAYTAGMEVAARQVAGARAAGQEPSASLWSFMDDAVGDLDGLLLCLDEQDCEGLAPPYETIAAPETVAAQAEEFNDQLKNLAVALEYSGRPPAAPGPARITFFEFAEEIFDDEGDFTEFEITDSFPAETGQVYLLVDYEGMQDGQLVVLKVFLDAEEELDLRQAFEWSAGPAGETEFVLSYGLLYAFDPGDYWVEMYVDGRLVQQGGFTVEETQ